MLGIYSGSTAIKRSLNLSLEGMFTMQQKCHLSTKTYRS